MTFPVRPPPPRWVDPGEPIPEFDASGTGMVTADWTHAGPDVQHQRATKEMRGANNAPIGQFLFFPTGHVDGAWSAYHGQHGWRWSGAEFPDTFWLHDVLHHGEHVIQKPEAWYLDNPLVNTASSPQAAPAGTKCWRITHWASGAFVGYLYRPNDGSSTTWWIAQSQVKDGAIAPSPLRFALNTAPLVHTTWAVATDSRIPHPYPPTDRGNTV